MPSLLSRRLSDKYAHLRHTLYARHITSVRRSKHMSKSSEDDSLPLFANTYGIPRAILPPRVPLRRGREERAYLKYRRSLLSKLDYSFIYRRIVVLQR